MFGSLSDCWIRTLKSLDQGVPSLPPGGDLQRHTSISAACTSVAVDECQTEAAAHNTHRGVKKNNSNIYLVTSTKLMEGKKKTLNQNSFTGWEEQRAATETASPVQTRPVQNSPVQNRPDQSSPVQTGRSNHNTVLLKKHNTTTTTTIVIYVTIQSTNGDLRMR